MAFRGQARRDIKKSSYYVWFLGAKESKGLRGEEFVRPVLRYFTDRERDMEPVKVTLQVSNRGLKIIQTVTGRQNLNRTETIKHFIPHHSITCVVQDDDVVSCILLIYNPITRCPVHVHSYRCDSRETATTLKNQLKTLVSRPENLAKFEEIERRLQAKGLLVFSKRTASEDRSSSGSSGGSAGGGGASSHIANLYDSLAAELREKLGGKTAAGPLLLPPRDYDTVNRSRGNLSGIDSRRCRNLNIIGLKGSPPYQEDSSGKSSGIGSDDAPSPVQERDRDFETSRDLDAQSSSDEEWEQHRHPLASTAESMLLVQPPPSRRRPPEARQRSPSPPTSPRSRFQDARQKFKALEKDVRRSPPRNRQVKSPERDYIDKDYKEHRNSRDFSKSREDLQWPKSDKDTGYVSKDGGLGTKDRRWSKSRDVEYDTGYASKIGRDSRERIRSHDFDDEPEWQSPRRRPEMFGLADERYIHDIDPSRDFRRENSRESSGGQRRRERYSSHENLKSRHVEHPGYIGESRGRVIEHPPKEGYMPEPRHGYHPPRIWSPERRSPEVFRYGKMEKRKSMYDLLEDERKQAPRDDFKRRSYSDLLQESRRVYQELPPETRFPGLDRETARIDHMVEPDFIPRRNGYHNVIDARRNYRHSYAEPSGCYFRPNAVPPGRVGLAAVHPY